MATKKFENVGSKGTDGGLSHRQSRLNEDWGLLLPVGRLFAFRAKNPEEFHSIDSDD